MKLETNRLEIVALDEYYLKLITEDISRFEKELNCEYCGEEMKGIILQIFKNQIEVVKQNRDNYIWHTFWLFKLKSENKFIGSACFKNISYKDAQAEIGYGINTEFENQGYTTEAVDAMCKWALSKANIAKIIAETEIDNIPSQRVLKKCNMRIFKETEGCYWWELCSKSEYV